MEPLLQPRMRKEPAVSWLLMGTTSWFCTETTEKIQLLTTENFTFIQLVHYSWDLQPPDHHAAVSHLFSDYKSLKWTSNNLNQQNDASPLTCQCLVTAFHTPTFPAWLVAISWLPTKKRASTGTFRLKTPAGGRYDFRDSFVLVPGILTCSPNGI